MLAVTRVVITGIAVLLAGCGTGDPLPTAADGVQQLRVEVLDTMPHDPDLFTQGFEIADGVLYEGTGLVGRSRLRATELDERMHPAGRLDEARLPPPLFGEGITVVGPRIWQLTWTDGVAVERDRATLDERRRVGYAGEGWGLCHDGRRLVMSNGTERLTFRDPASFAETGGVDVRRDGEPVRRLNELECARGVVWANVWQTDQIVRIDPDSGTVTGVVDASGLLSAQQQATSDVLNGIAAIPGTEEFLITGKNWPSIFRVRFVPA